MKTLISIVVSTTIFLFAASAYSHAPELHKKEGAEKPQCAEFEKMEHSKMDANDPVMQAMMAQCKDWLHDTHEDTKKDKPDKSNIQEKNNNSRHKQHQG